MAPILGFSHCEAGDQRVFGAPPIVYPSRVELSPLVLASSSFSGPGKLVIRSISVYTNGIAEARRVDRESGEELSEEVYVSLEDLSALHEELASAGAGDLTGAVPDSGVIFGYNSGARITFFEPSLAHNRAWANTFFFGNGPLDPRAGAAWSVVWTFAQEHFGAAVLSP
jgi:hypothetical protein